MQAFPRLWMSKLMTQHNTDLKRQYPHPLNETILNSYLGGHPDFGQILSDLGATLPTECRVGRYPYAGSYACQMLVHEGIVFGAHLSMEAALRLPLTARQEAVAAGGTATPHLGEDWVAIARVRDYAQSERLVRIAYDYAAELAQSSEFVPPTEKVVIACPSCSQKLRLPTDRGTLTVTCPKCSHHWEWAP